MHLAQIEQHSCLQVQHILYVHTVCTTDFNICCCIFQYVFFYVPRCDLISVDWITIVMEIKTFIRKMEKWTKEVLYTMYSRGFITLKPDSWTYNQVEVSGHNLGSSQTWGFCMDFLNHCEGGMVFYQVFLLYPLPRNCKRLLEFEEIEISSKAIEVTVNNKEENS